MAREEDVPPYHFRSLMQERSASGRKTSYTLSREGSWEPQSPSHYVPTHRAPPPASSLEPSMVHRFSSAPPELNHLDDRVYVPPRQTPTHDRNSRDSRSFGKVEYQHEPQSEISYSREQRYTSLPSKPLIQRGVSDYGYDRSYQPLDSGRFSETQLDRDRPDTSDRISYRTPPRTPTSYSGVSDRGSYGRQISGPPSVSDYESFRSVSVGISEISGVSKDRGHNSTHVGFASSVLSGSMVNRQHFFHRSLPDMVDQHPSPNDQRHKIPNTFQPDAYRYDETRRPEAGVREVRSLGEAEMGGPGGYPRRTSTGSPRRGSTMGASASALSPHPTTRDYAPIESPRGLLGNRLSQSASRVPYVSRSGHDEIPAGMVTPPYSRHPSDSSYVGGSENWRNDRTEKIDREFASKSTGGYGQYSGQQRYESGAVDGVDRRGSGYGGDMTDEILRHQRLVEQVNGQYGGRCIESPTRRLNDYALPPLEPRSPTSKVQRPPASVDLPSTSGEADTTYAGAPPLRPMTPPTPLTRPATPPTPGQRTGSPLQRIAPDTDRALTQRCRDGYCQAASYRQMAEEKERRLKELEEREAQHQQELSLLLEQVAKRDSALQEWEDFVNEHLPLNEGKVVFEPAQAEELSDRLHHMSLLLEKGKHMMFPWETADTRAAATAQRPTQSSAADIIGQSEELETRMKTLLARAKTMDTAPIGCPVQ
eukprot:comp23621_c0_seq1/m.40221 comp23621_c0_seq1/g.40221  ORF comp23621_c0_seq1/g.40221 comp23621_c0_seq1/m.40221 type:complete len:706 (-) comp23621_c0_seq1:500-2617(-)